MNLQPVSSMEGFTRSRLVTIHANAVLREVAARTSSTQVNLVVVRDAGQGSAG